MRGPKVERGFEVQPHLYRVRGDDPCPSLSGHRISDTNQVTVHVWACIQHEQVSTCSAVERLNPFQHLQSRKQKSPISGTMNHYYTWNWPFPRSRLALTVTESLVCSHPSSICFIFLLYWANPFNDLGKSLWDNI